MSTTDIQAIIDRTRLSFQQTLPVVVFEVTVKEDPAGSFEISGTMLLERQKQKLLAEIRAISGQSILDRIVTVEQNPKLLVQSKGLTNVYAKPDSHKLTTQIRPDEQVKVLYTLNTLYLVLLEDGTAGWAESSHLPVSGPDQKLAWHHPQMVEGQIAPDSISALQFCAIAGSYLEVSYVLGGRSRAGIDCSALTQLVYLEACGRLLPRHSWNQKIFGREMASSLPERSEDLTLGDLIFAVSKRTGEKHVGIYFGADRILHASGAMKRVAIWNVNVFCKLYTIASWRRMLTIEAPKYA